VFVCGLWKGPICFLEKARWQQQLIQFCQRFKESLFHSYNIVLIGLILKISLLLLVVNGAKYRKLSGKNGILRH